MISFQGVYKTFYQGAKEIRVLENLNFKLDKNGLVAIVGKSGSGKSTFLSLLAGLDRPSSGQIKINTSAISEMSESELTLFRAKNIGIIFQHFHLVNNFTALENVMLPLEVLGDKDAVVKAKEILSLVGLEKRVHHFPHELSGGEKQRVAIARACVAGPQIILADEPSGNLDPETGEVVMKTLIDTARKLQQTVLLVTHDHDLAAKCDYQFELKDHKLLEIA